MKRTILIGAVAIALVASACAESESGGSADAATANPGPSTTTIATPTVADSGGSSATTVPPATTTAPPTTTTVAPPTTTTVAPPTTITVAPTTTIALSVEEQGFGALVQSLEVSDTMVSGRMEGSMLMTGLDPEETGVSEAEIVFAWAFDDESGDSLFMVDMSSLSAAMNPSTDQAELDSLLPGRFETRQIGDRAFLNFPVLTTMLGAETDWISMPVEGSEQFTDGFEGFRSEPGAIMDSYEGAAASLETIGREEANGVSTIHYRITLETDGLIEQMTPSERDAAGYFPFLAEGVVPLELWVSDDGYVVRMVMEINADMVETSPDDELGSFVTELNMFDINERIVVSQPPAADVTAIEDLETMFLGLDLEG